MSKRLLIPMVLLFVLPFIFSCSDDSDDNIVIPDPDAYRALTVRDNVLFNLSKAWNERNLVRYDELLDDVFVFHFSNADVKNGDVMISEWDRPAEMAAVGNMFDPEFVKPGQSAVSSINLTLTYTEGEDSWQELDPDPQEYPGETWYSKVFRYRLTLEAGYFTYVGDNLQALVTVRRPDGEGGSWRIVSWNDDMGNLLYGLSAATTLTQDTTWGKMKALYSD